MRKYHRLLIYVVFGGLSFSLVLIVTLMVADGRRREENGRSERPTRRSDSIGGTRRKESIASEQEIQRILRNVEAENNKRLERIENTCKKYNLGLFRTAERPAADHPPVPQYGVYYSDRTNGFSFCPIYKAGSSTWLYNLCLLAGMTEGEMNGSMQQLSVLARTRYPELEPPEAQEVLESTIKFMTVRHPFERLLSAYRDKLENTNHGREHGTLHFYRKFGSKIVKKYREKGNETKVWDLLKPFQYMWNPEVPKPAGVEPTFREFVRYLIDTNLLLYADDHWIPYYLYCTPCLLRYDVIAKVETMDQDQLYIIRLLRLEDKIQPKWRHKTQFLSGAASDDGRVSELAKVYFKQLSASEVNSLYEKYKIDFDLFGYEYEGYLRFASDFDRINL